MSVDVALILSSLSLCPGLTCTADEMEKVETPLFLSVSACVSVIITVSCMANKCNGCDPFQLFKVHCDPLGLKKTKLTNAHQV